jgi:hypothetical protein
MPTALLVLLMTTATVVQTDAAASALPSDAGTTAPVVRSVDGIDLTQDEATACAIYASVIDSFYNRYAGAGQQQRPVGTPDIYHSNLVQCVTGFRKRQATYGAAAEQVDREQAHAATKLTPDQRRREIERVAFMNGDSPAARYFRQEQQRREQERQAEASEQDVVDEAMKDPRFVRAELSNELCYVAASKKHAKQMLDNQRQQARAGLGVIDKEEVYTWQGELLILSKLDGLVRGELRHRKLSPGTCDPKVSDTFASCIDDVRQSTMILGAGDDEYMSSAKRIFDAGPGCMPRGN